MSMKVRTITISLSEPVVLSYLDMYKEHFELSDEIALSRLLSRLVKLQLSHLDGEEQDLNHHHSSSNINVKLSFDEL